MKPSEEQAVRRKLGQAMLKFVEQIMMHRATEDGDAMRRHYTENYRLAVMEAVEKGIESSLAWHTLGVWTEEGKERIGCFARSLEAQKVEIVAGLLATDARGKWCVVHSRADCLYEIGRVHAAEGDAEVAKGFLSEALPLAQEADRLRSAAGITNEDNLEGKIAVLLCQLP